MRFGNKSVIVTASAGAGIGQATARAFAKEGASVVVNTSREKSLKRLDAVVDDINRSGGKAIGVELQLGLNDHSVWGLPLFAVLSTDLFSPTLTHR